MNIREFPIGSQALLPLLFMSLFRILAFGAELTVAEIKQLEQIVSTLPQTTSLDDREEQRQAIRNACEAASVAHAYSVFRAAINNPNLEVRIVAMSAFFKNNEWGNNSREELKPILMSALVNPSIWPDPSAMNHERDGPLRTAAMVFQIMFYQRLSDAFGSEFKINNDLDQPYWSEADRIAISKKLGLIGAAHTPGEIRTNRDSVSKPLGSDTPLKVVSSADRTEQSSRASRALLLCVFVAIAALAIVFLRCRRGK